MHVYLCTFQIALGTVKLPESTKLLEIEAVLRSQKGEVIIVGAMKPLPKRGTAVFNQAFEIKTDLLRDPQTELYHSNIILLEIRRVNQSLNTKVSPSVCRFNLAEVLNLGPIPEKAYSADDKSFTAMISIKCHHIEDTGKRRPLRKKSEKRLSSHDSGSAKGEIQRSRQRSKQKKPGLLQRSTQQKKKDTSQLQNQLKTLKDDYERQELQHILTQQRLKKTQMSLVEQENLVNQLSALVNQRETDVVELTTRISSIQEEIISLEERNQEVSNFVREKNLIEHERDALKLRIQELEKALQASTLSYSALLTSQSKLQISLQQEEEKYRQLCKTTENIKKDMLRLKMENESLLSSLKKNDSEKESLKESVRLWKEQMTQNFEAKNKEYQFLRQQFSKLQKRQIENTQRHSQRTDMVIKSELQQVQKYYQSKISEYQQKENELKKQIDIIEKEMAMMEDLLEEKQENEQILIDHAKKLQHDLDVANSSSNWWIKILSDELEHNDTSPNGRIRQTSEVGLRSRNGHLLKILQESSPIILESEKNKREVLKLQKNLENLERNMMDLREESREVKEKLSVMLKENKKLLEKNGKNNREIDSLKRSIRKLTHELTSVKSRENQLIQQYQTLNVERSLLEHQISKMKDWIDQDHKFMKEQDHNENQSHTVWKRHTKEMTIPMPLINQNSQEMMISMPLQSIQGSEKGHDKNPQSITARQISELLEKRGSMLDELFTQISKASQEKQLSGEPLRKELKKMTDLSTRFKLVLIKAGQKEAVKDWELSIRRLSEEVDRLFLSH